MGRNAVIGFTGKMGPSPAYHFCPRQGIVPCIIRNMVD
jgi:hypothetical protein